MLAALAYAYKTPITALRQATGAEINAMVWFLQQMSDRIEQGG